jgi:hypothetical protein
MEKKKIKLKFQNGLTFELGVEEILAELTAEYEFIESEHPDFIIFGPYGNDIPAKGNYIRVGYYCECITPDLTNCDWAFGVPPEEEINHSKYKRIQWHGLDPEVFIKNIDVEEVFNNKTKFCNFLYSNQIKHRNVFYRQLVNYKPVDAPGKCEHNMPGIDEQYTGSKWEIKRKFLTPYKFTVAFESDIYPGYQTEKLYDAMRSNSIPIYCGDPLIKNIFNPASFINAFDYVKINNGRLKNFLEKFCQYDFKDYRPGTYGSLYYKVRRKLKTIARKKKIWLLLNRLDYSPLIEKIKELDSNPDIYKAMLSEPWFRDNEIPDGLSSRSRWQEIFNSSLNG